MGKASPSKKQAKAKEEDTSPKGLLIAFLKSWSPEFWEFMK
ncbi:hypothetical protein TrRE_jg12355, partial [Triparma retinervis]